MQKIIVKNQIDFLFHIKVGIKYFLYKLFLGDSIKRDEITAMAFLLAKTPTRTAIAETLYDNSPLTHENLYSIAKGIVYRNLTEDYLPEELGSAKGFLDILKERGVIDERMVDVYLKTIEEYKTEDFKSRPSPKSFDCHLEKFMENGLVRVYEDGYELTKLGKSSVERFIEILKETEEKLDRSN